MRLSGYPFWEGDVLSIARCGGGPELLAAYTSCSARWQWWLCLHNGLLSSDQATCAYHAWRCNCPQILCTILIPLFQEYYLFSIFACERELELLSALCFPTDLWTAIYMNNILKHIWYRPIGRWIISGTQQAINFLNQDPVSLPIF